MGDELQGMDVLWEFTLPKNTSEASFLLSFPIPPASMPGLFCIHWLLASGMDNLARLDCMLCLEGIRLTTG